MDEKAIPSQHIAELYLVHSAQTDWLLIKAGTSNRCRCCDVVCILALFGIRRRQIEIKVWHPFDILLDLVAIGLCDPIPVTARKNVKVPIVLRLKDDAVIDAPLALNLIFVNGTNSFYTITLESF